MSGMGPPPKNPDQRARRNATVGMVQLPAKGRSGRSPAWPLIDDVRKTARRQVLEEKAEQLRWSLQELESGARRAAVERKLDVILEDIAVLDIQLATQRGLETQLWRSLWKTPQAVAWERLGWTREVAQYVRHKVLGELGDLDDAKEARQWSDRLGLTPMAMLRLRWEISTDEVGDRRESAAPASAARRSFAALKAVPSGQ